MTAAIRWENPPPVDRTGTGNSHGCKPSPHWAAIADELQTRPGEWALLATSTDRQANDLAALIRAGRLAAFRPAGAFDAVSRTVDDEIRCYARYGGTR